MLASHAYTTISFTGFVPVNPRNSLILSIFAPTLILYPTIVSFNNLLEYFGAPSTVVNCFKSTFFISSAIIVGASYLSSSNNSLDVLNT